MKLTKAQAKNRKRYYTVYKITNTVNGLCYIGQHRIFRGNSEDDGYGGSGTKIKQARMKYGNDKFEKVILHRVSTIREANALERREIRKYDSTNPKKGYNIQKGGNVFANQTKYIEGANIYIKKRRRK